MRLFKLCLPVLGFLLYLATGSQARAQAVAFIPTPAVIPDGVTMNVTPVATADRRYVRLSVQPQFIGFVAFDTFPVPGAVSGGGGVGFGGLGGLGGLGGGGGGRLGGGLANVPVGFAGQFDAGMGGVQGPADPYAGYYAPVVNPSGPPNPAAYMNDPLRRAAMQQHANAALVAPTPRANRGARKAATHRRTSSSRAKRAGSK